MSEEERQAIDKINRQIVIGKAEKNIGIPVYISDLEKILNLIEKQSKEIEEIKNLNKHQSKDLTKAVNYTFELNKEIDIKDKMIEEMLEEIYEHRYQNNLDFFKNAKTAKEMTPNLKDIKEYYRKEVVENG